MESNNGKDHHKSNVVENNVDNSSEVKSSAHLDQRKYLLLMALAAVVLVFILYSQILHSPFLFDDIQNIKENQYIRISNLSPAALINAGFKGSISTRPVAQISFALDYFFHGYQPAGYHVVNIIIHLLTGFFLFLLLRVTLQITKTKSLSPLVSDFDNVSILALAAVFVWLVHPLQTQSVTYIVQRMNSMAAMFYVLSMLCYVKGRLTQEKANRWMLFGSCIISGVLAVGSKEIAATLPFFILLYEWYFFSNLNTTWLRRNLLVISGAVIFIVVLGLIYFGASPLNTLKIGYMTRDFTLTQRILSELRIVLMYLGLIFFPYPGRLNLDYDFPLSYSLIHPPTTLLSLLIIVGLIIFSIYIAKRDRIVSFTILWFFGNLFIESSVIPLELVYEHRTYMPSMFVILLTIILLNKYLKLQWARVLLLCLVVSLFSIWTYQRNHVWENEFTLWQDCLKKSPNKARTHSNYAMALILKGKVDEAIVHFRRAVELKPNIPIVHTNLGQAYMQKGMIDEAIVQMKEAIKANPFFIDSYQNLAQAMEKSGQPEDALKYYTDALKIEPGNVEVLNGVGKTLAGQKRYDEAMSYFTSSLKYNPDYAETYNDMGNVLLMQGKIEDAKKQYFAAIQKNSDYQEAYYNLGTTFMKQGRVSDGIVYLEKAVSLSPDYEKAHSSLATAYYSIFALDNSIQQFREVLRINPGNLNAQQNLKACLDRKIRLDSAILDARKQIVANPDNAELHFKLGDLLQRRGELDRSVVELQKTLSIKQLPQALHSMAVIYSIKGDYAEAIHFLEEMRKLKPDDPEVQYNLACIYSKQGRVDDALHYLQEAVHYGFNKWDMMKTDPDLENVRGAEGYKKLIKSN
jgi:protein O-mannosyl-transferase